MMPVCGRRFFTQKSQKHCDIQRGSLVLALVWGKRLASVWTAAIEAICAGCSMSDFTELQRKCLIYDGR